MIIIVNATRFALPAEAFKEAIATREEMQYIYIYIYIS